MEISARTHSSRRSFLCQQVGPRKSQMLLLRDPPVF
jgi:hypothetical protein